MAKSDRRQQATGIYDEAVANLGGDAPVPAPTPAERSAAVRGRRTIPWRRDEMELWELDPRKSRTRKQIEDMAVTMRVAQDIPIIARLHPDPAKRALNIIQIIAGGTRWESAAPDLADRPILDVDLRDIPDDREALQLAWRTNSTSNPHSAIDNALYFKQMLQMEGVEKPEQEPTESTAAVKRDASLRKVGAEHGIGKDRVAQFVKILLLPPKILAVFLPPKPPKEGEQEPQEQTEGETEDADEQRVEWNEKHARALLKLQPYPDEQNQLFLEIKRGKMSGNAAVARADILEANARQDAGLEPKPKKTRKPKVTPVSSALLGGGGSGPTSPPAGTPPVGTAPPAVTPPPATPPKDAPSEEGDESEDAPPDATGSDADTTIEEVPNIEAAFQPVVDNLAHLAVQLEKQKPTLDEARRVGFLAGRMRALVTRISSTLDQVQLQEESR